MSDLSEKQKVNSAYFKQNLNQFLSNPMLKNKFIIIHDEKMVGSFDSFENALNDAIQKYPNNEFVIQQVISESDTVSFLFAARKTA